MFICVVHSRSYQSVCFSWCWFSFHILGALFVKSNRLTCGHLQIWQHSPIDFRLSLRLPCVSGSTSTRRLRSYGCWTIASNSHTSLPLCMISCSGSAPSTITAEACQWYFRSENNFRSSSYSLLVELIFLQFSFSFFQKFSFSFSFSWTKAQ